MIEEKIITPIQKFIRTESFSGILLLGVTALAIIVANSPFSPIYHALWRYELGFESEHFHLVKPVILWINDGLMAVFFFLIGLEIKREVLIGELNSMKKMALPVFAAIGGMVVPLSLFLILNDDPATERGWGIPMATDIAFALLVLTVLGKRIPLGLKIFLTAVAIIDDVGAVVVIALFYTQQIGWELLMYAFILLFTLYLISYLKWHSKYIFLLFGIVIWLLFLKSGIHPTIAGILLAFAVPVRQKINEFEYAEKLRSIVNKIVSTDYTSKLPVLTHKQIQEIDNLEDWTARVQSPLQLLERRLHKWVAFFIIPIFAFANAGISFGDDVPVNYALSTNIAISLFAGKFIGIFLFSFILIKFKLATLPSETNFRQIVGVALLAGIGFTMSLFIGNLAFLGDQVSLSSVKIGILIGSGVSGTLGLLVLRFGKKPALKNTGV